MICRLRRLVYALPTLCAAHDDQRAKVPEEPPGDAEAQPIRPDSLDRPQAPTERLESVTSKDERHMLDLGVAEQVVAYGSERDVRL